jgi:hypothetical protein
VQLDEVSAHDGSLTEIFEDVNGMLNLFLANGNW